MNIALIKNGIVENVIIADLAFAEALGYDHAVESDEAGIGWAYNGETFAAPPQPEPELVPLPRHVTRLSFKKRFTRAERIGIDIAAIDDPFSPTEARRMSASLRDMQSMVSDSSFIDLDREDTRQLVQELEYFHFLAPGRAAEILDAEVLDIERPTAENPVESEL